MIQIKSIIIITILFLSFEAEAKKLGNYNGIEIHKVSNKLVFLNGVSRDTIPESFLSKDERQAVNEILNYQKLSKELDKGPEFPENIPRFERARIFAFIVCLSFLINIPFFINWAKKETGSDEVLLYNVEGKFSYLSIVMWIDRMERLYEKPLSKERREIERFYNVSNKAKRSISLYKRKIHDILLIKAIGPRMVKTAIRRMNNYSKLTYAWDVAVYLSVIYAMICMFSIEMSWMSSLLIGLVVGNIVAAPVWLVCHLILNHSLKSATRKGIKSGEGVGLRIIMAQFYGAFGGLFWKDLYYIQGKSSWTFAGNSGRFGYGEKTTASKYSTGWSKNESEKDLDFDD